LFLLVAVVVVSFVRAPGATMRFYKLQKQDGKSAGKAIKNIYQNAHILSQKVDWLHYSFSTFALGRESLAKAIKARMAISIRGFDIAIYPLKHPNSFSRIWQYTDKVHTISDDLLTKAKAAGMPDRMPYKKVTPAIEADSFTAKEKPGSISPIVQLLTVGRVHWKKGYEHALIALQKLKAKGIAFRYTIIGTGPELERLKYAVNTFGLNEEIQFAGKLSHEEVKKRLKHADIYLQPSLQEGFCNSVLEAQLSGLLCIVSDAEGLSENVINNQTGWVVPRRNSQALADKIIEVINLDEPTRWAIAEKAMLRVKSEFNLQKQKAEFADFYRS
jgi:colanic acid/amylovoran biosynthesis glycosyltransferase